MLMSDAVRESLAPYYKDYLELAEAASSTNTHITTYMQ